MNKEQFIKELNSMGYVTEGHKFQDFTNSKGEKDIGMKVGRYQHSCHVGSSDINVLLCLRKNNEKHGHLYDIYFQEDWDI